MERVAFLLERTGQRLGCMLNPESLVVRRSAGVRPRRSLSGPLTGVGLRDDPLLYTGGGRTELEMDLLFDVSLAGSSITAEDVRDLTGPLWALAENAPEGSAYGRPPLVHFVWGKTWNLPGIVSSVAERLEYFTAEGTPRRSWLRMRMVRVNQVDARAAAAPPAPGDWIMPSAESSLSAESLTYEMIGGGNEDEIHRRLTEERLDEIAYRRYGDPGFWRYLATVNNLDDPLKILAGSVVQIPSAGLMEGQR